MPPLQASGYGSGGEGRQLIQSDIHAKGATLAFVTLEMVQDISIDICRVEQIAEQQFGIDVGHHQIGRQTAAVNQVDPLGPTFNDFNAAYFGLCFDGHAMGQGLRCHGLGDGTHATDSMAPDAGSAVDLAYHMVQQHIGRAR